MFADALELGNPCAGSRLRAFQGGNARAFRTSGNAVNRGLPDHLRRGASGLFAVHELGGHYACDFQHPLSYEGGAARNAEAFLS